VQACGDAHLANFGVYATPERALVFDLNDFDETLPGPWEWDVKRLAASLEVAGRGNGYQSGKRRQVVTAAVRRYREAMRVFAGQDNLAVWYARAETGALREQFGSQLAAREQRQADRAVAKARTRDSLQALAKLTRQVDGRPRIAADPAPGRAAVGSGRGPRGPGDAGNRAQEADRRLPADPGNRPPLPAGAVRLR
jgi:uncharacterized protein (DUF2252 family)